MLTNRIRLGLLDDHTLFRKTLRTYMVERSNFHVELDVSNIFELLNKLQVTPIDLLVVDLFLPEVNGSDTVKIIRRDYPDIKLVVLSMTLDIDLIGSVLEEGVHAFVSKSDEPEELISALEAAAANKVHRNRIFTEALYWNTQHRRSSLTNVTGADLSDREKRILQLIWEEKSSKEIGEILYLGIRSVEKIRQDIKEKTGTASTIGLLKYAIEKKIINIALSRFT